VIDDHFDELANSTCTRRAAELLVGIPVTRLARPTARVAVGVGGWLMPQLFGSTYGSSGGRRVCPSYAPSQEMGGGRTGC